MRTRQGTSPWIHQFPASRVPEFPRFRGEDKAEVVVIGGGLTGCATAYLAASAGSRTILLERERIGQGGTGRSAGLMMPHPDASFRDVAGLHGMRAARRVFETWRKGALDAAALLRRLGVQCYLDPREVVAASNTDDERALRREYTSRQEAGLDVSWLNRKQMLDRWRLDAAGGLKIPDAFMLDPYRACLGLVAEATRRRVACYERSYVRKVRFDRKSAEVVTEGGTIQARHVVIATGTVTAEFKQLQRHLERRETYFACTETVPAAVRRQLGDPRGVLTDVRVPLTLGWTRDNRLVVAGADQRETPARLEPAVLTQRTGQLMYELLKRYPAILGLQPEYSWHSVYGRTADGLMYIGAHRNYPHQLFAVGGSPIDLTGAFVAARVLVRAIREAPEKGDELFGWTR